MCPEEGYPSQPGQELEGLGDIGSSQEVSGQRKSGVYMTQVKPLATHASLPNHLTLAGSLPPSLASQLTLLQSAERGLLIV